MKTILTVFLFLSICSSSFAEGIEGTWKANLDGPNGSMEMTFIFKMEGTKLTGRVLAMENEMPISNTAVKEKEFTFDVAVNDMTISHICTLVDNDTIKMKTTGSPMGDSEIILKRQN
jgi:hypothetical protein